MSLVDDEISPSDLVQSGLLDTGNLVSSQQHIPVTLRLRYSRFYLVGDDSCAFVLSLDRKIARQFLRRRECEVDNEGAAARKRFMNIYGCGFDQQLHCRKKARG